MRATPLLRVKANNTVKNAVRESLRRQHTEFLTVTLTLTCMKGVCSLLERDPLAYGEFDCEFGFDSHEWGCSNAMLLLCRSAWGRVAIDEMARVA